MKFPKSVLFGIKRSVIFEMPYKLIMDRSNFSLISPGSGKREIGLKSLTNFALLIFGRCITVAFFHSSGNLFSSIDLFRI